MKKFFTPMIVVLAVAMITAFVIGQIGARTDRTADKPVIEKAADAEAQTAQDVAADTQAEGEETTVAEDVTPPAPKPHETPLTTLIEDAAVEEFSLKTFADIVTSAQLEGLMTPEDGGRLTVFVPNDSAFANMAEEARSALVEGDASAAAAFLKAHLVSGHYTLQAINDKAKDNTLTLTTLAGTKMTLVREEGGPWAIEGAEGVRYFIMRPDALRANGVGQVINGVLPSQ